MATSPKQTGIKGFIKSTPQRTFHDGRARFFAYAGVPDREWDPAQGEYIDQGTKEVQLVMFGPSAERAYANFQRGDVFLAQGKSSMWTPEHGDPVEQFKASDIAHSNNVTNYTVDRSRPDRQVEHDAAARDLAQAGPETAAPEGAATAEGPGAPETVPVQGAPEAAPDADTAAQEPDPAGVQAQVAEVLAQREAQVAAAPTQAAPTAAQQPDPVGR